MGGSLGVVGRGSLGGFCSFLIRSSVEPTRKQPHDRGTPLVFSIRSELPSGAK